MEFKPMGKTYSEFGNLEKSVKFEFKKLFITENRDYLQELLQKTGSRWVLVLSNSGELYSHGNDLSTLPSNEEICLIGKKTGQLPYTYVRAPVIDTPVFKELE